MRSILLLILLPLFILPPHISFGDALDLNQKFEQCNALAGNGSFQKAIPCYENIVQQNGYSPGLLFNLGNSYSMAGQPGMAILNYERALRLAPGDEDIRANLAQIRKDLGLFKPELKPLDTFFHLLRLDQWSLLILFGAGLFALSISALLILPQTKNWTKLTALFGLLILLPAVAGTAIRLKDFDQYVITTAETTPLLLSPFKGAQVIGSLQEGRLVLRDQVHKDFIRVDDRNGRQGWIPAEKARAICQ